MSYMYKIKKWYQKNKPSGIISMSVYRLGNYTYYKIKISILRHLLLFIYAILDNLFVKLLCNSEIPAKCIIGKNIWLPHGANGIVIHGKAIIGDNVTIFHQVTVGAVKNPNLAPRIESGVQLGAGAKVLGDISIGTGAKIGANAVVLKNVPQNSTAVGVPARIITKK
ncbi:serine O-acetyltransferase [Pseudalkalibacillus caeni]|uniref:Serine acetyltransferase n=1 Tax=Exobacillus caeni TaxID=2574798 RepID=A0A5R9F143_9BACL|nr:serine acetyltransferase [Pseudalkalibacillus caeni]TLS35158.1 serine acetyltransferase [Pseudalkalibacillus caeni]